MTTSPYHTRLNEIAYQSVPELDSDYARFPISYDRWRRPEESLDNGSPCYVVSAKDVGLRRDYIFCQRGIAGPGYYHFRTLQANVAAYEKFVRNGPSVFSRLNQRRRDYEMVKRNLRNRIMCEEPDDILAARMALANVTMAGSTAKAAGHALYLPTLTTSVLLSLGHN